MTLEQEILKALTEFRNALRKGTVSKKLISRKVMKPGHTSNLRDGNFKKT